MNTSNQKDGYFRDHHGKASMMRLVWAFSVIVTVTTWAVISLMNGKLESLTMGDAMWLGMLFGGKVGQSYIEQKKEGGT